MPGNYFQSIFGRSPFKPMQRHMETCHRCASLVLELLDQSAAGDWQAVTETQRKIHLLAGEADEIKREIRTHLPSGFFLPVSRPDLLELLVRQDDLAKKAKDIAGLMLGRHIQFPEPLVGPVREMAEASLEACGQALAAVNELDELLETGFGGIEAERVREMIQLLDSMEGRADRLEIDVRAGLFRIEADLPAVHVIFLYRLIDWIEQMADIAQHIGHRLEVLLAK